MSNALYFSSAGLASSLLSALFSSSQYNSRDERRGLFLEVVSDLALERRVPGEGPRDVVAEFVEKQLFKLLVGLDVLDSLGVEVDIVVLVLRHGGCCRQRFVFLPVKVDKPQLEP